MVADFKSERRPASRRNTWPGSVGICNWLAEATLDRDNAALLMKLKRSAAVKDEDIIAHLDSISEDEMVKQVIVPLYRKRFKTFKKVEFSGKDKREDDGIDITYYEIGRETKLKEYGGVQAKQGTINTGKGANGIAAIGLQAQQAFNKPIANVEDKKTYRIHGYTVLTTGDIQPKARAQIVDQFEHKSIRFVDGKTLSEWIRESWLTEFIALFGSPEIS
jgi:hypothetical protein